MTSPIDYAIDVQTPFQAALQGYQGGAAIRNDQQQQQQLQQQQAAQQQQQKLLQSLSDPNATANDYARVMSLIPAVAEPLQKAWSLRNEAQQQQHLSDLSQWGYAIKTGHPEIASDAMRALADAMDSKSGIPSPQSKALRINAQIVDEHPEFAAGKIQAMLIAHPDGKKLADTLAALGGEQRAQDMAPDAARKAKAEADIKEAEGAVAPQKNQQGLQSDLWNVANIKSQIEERAARMGFDINKFTTDTQLKLTEMNQKFGQLPEDARKIVNESTLTAASSEQAVQQYQELAGKIDTLGGRWGAGGSSSAGEWLSRVWGNEDAVSVLKREYTRIASQGVIKLLPPGPASDKDIANAKEGIPNANASTTAVASYLRGMAKLSAYDAVINNAKAEWAGVVQHLGRARNDIVIDGTKVPAGTTFNEFARTYLANKAEALNSAATVSNRGYMRFATPSNQPIPGALGTGTYGIPGARQ